MFQNPIVLITGGSRGIGRATALLAASHGYAVVVNYLERSGAALTVVDDIRSGGGEAHAIQADVGCERDVTRLFEEIDSECGRLRYLVNNAGAARKPDTAAAISVDRFDTALRVNLRGVFLCVRGAVARMARSQGGDGGAIVNVSSYSVRTGGAFYHADYAAAKAGVEALTIGLAQELASDGIRVNAVAPGTTDTEMAATFMGDHRARSEKRIALRRFADPSEIAEGIVWLLSEKASYVTGSILPINGGRR